ncbi:amidase signature domain-containing protein [Paraphysoderma sedebokerense]|nr:amidase signature domain-containing protein [Paraphysoderma sedebokerense]
MRSHLQNGSIKATTVTEIYIKQAINAHLATNCIAEVMFEAALKRAKELDDILKKTGKPVGPLHGISFSVKDTFDIVGHDSSLGYTSQCFSPKTENSLLVDVLIKSGGILLCNGEQTETVPTVEEQAADVDAMDTEDISAHNDIINE